MTKTRRASPLNSLPPGTRRFWTQEASMSLFIKFMAGLGAGVIFSWLGSDANAGQDSFIVDLIGAAAVLTLLHVTDGSPL